MPFQFPTKTVGVIRVFSTFVSIVIHFIGIGETDNALFGNCTDTCCHVDHCIPMSSSSRACGLALHRQLLRVSMSRIAFRLTVVCVLLGTNECVRDSFNS